MGFGSPSNIQIHFINFILNQDEPNQVILLEVESNSTLKYELGSSRVAYILCRVEFELAELGVDSCSPLHSLPRYLMVCLCTQQQLLRENIRRKPRGEKGIIDKSGPLDLVNRLFRFHESIGCHLQVTILSECHIDK